MLLLASVAIAAWFGVTPFIIQYRAEVKFAEANGLATAVDQITRSLVNKILHPPIEQLKQLAHDPQGPDIAGLIRKIFNVKP